VALTWRRAQLGLSGRRWRLVILQPINLPVSQLLLLLLSFALLGSFYFTLSMHGVFVFPLLLLLLLLVLLCHVLLDRQPWLVIHRRRCPLMKSRHGCRARRLRMTRWRGSLRWELLLRMDVAGRLAQRRISD